MQQRRDVDSHQFFKHLIVLVFRFGRERVPTALFIFSMATVTVAVIMHSIVTGGFTGFQNGFLPGAFAKVTRLCADDLCGSHRNHGQDKQQVFKESRHGIGLAKVFSERNQVKKSSGALPG